LTHYQTAVYLSCIDVAQTCDFAIVGPFGDLDEVKARVGVPAVDFPQIRERARERLTRLTLVRRLDFTAPGTRALSYYSDDELLPGEAFWALVLAPPDSKALCLWLNSTLALVEFLTLQRETRGSFIDITSEKVRELHIPNFTKADVTRLVDAFELVRKEELPSLFDQFQEPCAARELIDQAVLQFLGYSDNEVASMLPKLYEAMRRELTSFSELMRATQTEETPAAIQLPFGLT
jgi:hypothetical protein